jgi:hypothetical protein
VTLSGGQAKLAENSQTRPGSFKLGRCVIVETDRGEFVAIPKEVGVELSKGDDIEVTRPGSAYKIFLENDHER